MLFLHPENILTMEIFYSTDIDGSSCRLGAEESGHCIKVLRHRAGDSICVIDGLGSMYECRITSDSPKAVEAEIMNCHENWGSHPYRLHLAVAPTKNADRFEWFAEKACEIGLDTITPVIGMHSERKVFKTQRVEKILVSAAKQSLKGAVPQVNEPVSVKDFISQYGTCGTDSGTGMSTADGDQGNKGAGQEGNSPLRLIAYCFEDGTHPRISIKDALANYSGSEYVVLIGPEGDFSREEAALALQHGFIPVHLGASRLRTETAAVTAAEAVYFRWM